MADKTQKKTPVTQYGHLITGGIAGAFSRTCTSPLERLKILRQTASAEYHSLTVVESFKYMWKEERLLGFFKGNGVNVIRSGPFSALEMYFYELYKHNIFKATDQLSFTSKLFCGGLTGMTASTLTYPLDIVRTFLSIQV